jgi:hypothetical protein
MSAAWAEQGRKCNAIKFDQPPPREARQSRQVRYMPSVVRHAQVQVPVKIQERKFHWEGRNPGNCLDFGSDSDFFTLDPNLATALRLKNAGGIRRRLSPARTWMTTQE